MIAANVMQDMIKKSVRTSSFLIVSFSEDKHTYIKCVDWCCDKEGVGNN